MAKNYNMYNYGTSPRKLEPEYTPNRRTKTNKPKANKSPNNSKDQNKEKEQKKIQEQNTKKQQIKVILYITIGFLILFAISYRN